MLLDLDFDIETGLPPWDFSIQYGGVRHAVKIPTPRQIARVMDAKDGTREAATKTFADVFAELTGIDRAVVEATDSECLRLFMQTLFNLVEKRLQLKAAARSKQLMVSPVSPAQSDHLN